MIFPNTLWKFDDRRDLTDFFPVWLDIASALTNYPPASGIEYRLSQAGNALQFVYTDLTASDAGDYLITDVASCGSSFNQNVRDADTVKITSSGVALSTDFLNCIAADSDKGVILVEGVATSTAPLVLNVVSNGITLCEAQLPLRLSGVEDMYRWINLRHVTLAKEARSSGTNEPSNYPDSLCNGKQVVFVHGFNVSEKQARAWNAEVFKRLYQSGSHAMYTAVTWQGDETPGILPSACYYHADVINAFQTAPAVAPAVASLPGQKYIAAQYGGVVSRA